MHLLEQAVGARLQVLSARRVSSSSAAETLLLATPSLPTPTLLMPTLPATSKVADSPPAALTSQ
jgi:hypothetical protein